MAYCAEHEKSLMLLLDRELEPAEEARLLAHLETCPACRAFVEQQKALEAELQSLRLPGLNEADRARFLEKVKQPEPNPLGRRLLSLAAAAAALILLFFAFQQATETHPPMEDRVEQADLEPALPPEDPQRLQAQAQLRDILAALCDAEDEELKDLFLAATQPLQEQGWQVENMLPGVLRRDSGEARLTALRLVSRMDREEMPPGMVTALIKLLKADIQPLATMTALQAQGGSRALAALGEALKHPEQQALALTLLIDLGGEEPVGLIEKALLDHPDFSTPFHHTAMACLARLGPVGMDSVLEIFRAADLDRKSIRAIPIQEPPVATELFALVERARGTRTVPAFQMAAALGFRSAVHPLAIRAEQGALKEEAPMLLAMLGGEVAVTTLVKLYEGPLSLKERKRISNALATVFHLFPEETVATLDEVMWMLPSESTGVMIEMLSDEGSPAACRTLARLLEAYPHRAPESALALARTGSSEALGLLLELIRSERLAPAARIAAGAAAFHLGGRKVLREIDAPVDEDLSQETGTPRALRRKNISVIRFNKLQEYIQGQTQS